MKVYIYATEGTYQGLHGVYNCQVVDVSDIEEANENMVMKWLLMSLSLMD